MTRRTLTIACVLTLAWLAPRTQGRLWAQGAPVSTGTLAVTGDVARPLTLSLADIKKLPRTKVEVKTEDGTVNVYEGVLAGELMRLAGATVGGQMRGNAVASYVLATASDGYQALFALAELDPAFTSTDILVADTIDGKPLLERQGPLRLVAPKDLRAARSVRMLQRLEVVRLKK
jgi:DMSO/TMAO reductase YedYZ molybdopterin-dependent catalytic subunit